MNFFRKAVLIMVWSFLSASAFAYTDRIDASAQEIFNAAQECFGKEGVLKSDAEKKSLTTKWIYTRIRRSRRRRFVPIHLQENVDLRYQLKIDIQDGKNYSDISIQGWFQEKATDAAPQQTWENSPSAKELYFKERESFFKILNALETRKKSANTIPGQKS